VPREIFKDRRQRQVFVERICGGGHAVGNVSLGAGLLT
jgi:hypothetical protein